MKNPTSFNIMSASELEGNFILEINQSILFPVIDRLLGGGPDTEQRPVPNRPLTEIEIKLCSRLTDLFMDELRTAWKNVIDLNLQVDRVESNPQLVQIVPPNEVVIVISFELSFGSVKGMMNLCIPFTSIERLAPKLSANLTKSGFEKSKPKSSNPMSCCFHLIMP